ncbi:hypothetical protein GQ53DRAFT_788166 [Thozetella sp. PMI_491]|nr:hypothetical protein GQ53DRAFT_788166 [Thozetella sp. PMI_491]
MSAPSFLARRSLSVCFSCRQTLLRQFSSSRSALAAFQSYPLSTPSPPRNAPGSESTITHAVQQPLPKVHETRPPRHPDSASAPALAPAPATPKSGAAPAPRPRSKLRAPRKAAMKLTPTAVSHLRDLLDQPEPKLIKVGVRNRGCSGLSYHLEFVDKAGAFDEAVEQDGVKVLIDSKALFSIIGSEMDWVEDKLSARFVFRNPNIKEECGCGESFMV